MNVTRTERRFKMTTSILDEHIIYAYSRHQAIQRLAAKLEMPMTRKDVQLLSEEANYQGETSYRFLVLVGGKGF